MKKQSTPTATERKTGRRGRGRPRVADCEAFASLPNYAYDETEFMLAMDAFKREKRRPFPTWCEVLEVLKSLGYRK